MSLSTATIEKKKTKESITMEQKNQVVENIIASQDGVNHINIDLTAATELGRQLAHFSKTPFNHPVFGQFNTMEGFWVYVRSAIPNDDLRYVTGRRAKTMGKSSGSVRVENFEEIILQANYYRVEQHPELLKLLVESTLPFENYYLYGDQQIMIRPAASSIMISMFENLRSLFKHNLPPPNPDLRPILERHQLALAGQLRKP